jgi:2-dehydro-3-deoxy-L-rhamnonate dehydrogenase (NAD+)
VSGSDERRAVYDLSERVAVVAGGAGGIGTAIVDRLVTSGARVWVVDIVRYSSQEASSIAVDITDRAQVAAAVEEIVEHDGRIDVLVNSGGYLGQHTPFDELPPDAWERIIATNLVGVLQTCWHLVPLMRRAGHGRIVNIGSLAGKHGLPNLALYSAASAGVIAFTKALAQELAATDIRVNSVAPGPIATDLILGLGDEVVHAFVESSPMNRLGTAEEVAELVVWLCSDVCSFTTGAVFDVSGGRAAY